MSVRKSVYVAYNFEINAPTQNVILSREFVAERLSPVYSDDAKSVQLEIYIWLRGGNSGDVMAYNKKHGRLSTRNRKILPATR